MIQFALAILRTIRTKLKLIGKGRYLVYGKGLHIGKGTRLWAPKLIKVGSHVYIGKDVHIEANCEIGDYCLIANRVAIVGRHDHDFSVVGFPIRYSPWVASTRFPSPYLDEKAVIESDVWIGYGSILLTGVTIGRGSVVAAGSIVSGNVPPYSIVAGVPAKVIGSRFKSAADIEGHEAAIRNGQFEFSERGYDFCLIKPLFNQ